MVSDVIKNVISTYLYGSSARPNKLDEQLIRADVVAPAPSVTFSGSDYMLHGGGRFTLPSSFDVIQQFFAVTTSLTTGSYDLTTMLSKLGLSSTSAVISIDQKEYGDSDFCCTAFY
jgi:hypothetical protein